MTWVLVFLACIGGQCRAVELPSAQCAMLGQIDVARWLGEHPGYTWDGRHRCRPAGEKRA